MRVLFRQSRPKRDGLQHFPPSWLRGSVPPSPIPCYAELGSLYQGGGCLDTVFGTTGMAGYQARFYQPHASTGTKSMKTMRNRNSKLATSSRGLIEDPAC